MASRVMKMRLLYSKDDKSAILQELMTLGRVEIAETDSLFSDGEINSFCKPEPNESEKFADSLEQLELALAIIKKHTPKQKTKQVLQLNVTASELFDSSEHAETALLAESITEYESKIQELQALKPAQHALIDEMSPWKTLELPLNFSGTADSAFILGMVSVYKDFPALKKELESTSKAIALFSLSTARKMHHVSIICLRHEVSLITPILAKYNFEYASFPTVNESAGEIIKKAEHKLSTLTSEQQELEAKISAAAEHYNKLLLYHDHLSSKIQLEKAISHSFSTNAYLITALWVSPKSISKLKEVLSKYLCALELAPLSDSELNGAPLISETNLFSRIIFYIVSLFKKQPKTSGREFKPFVLKPKHATISDVYANDDDSEG